jgi:cyanate permease
MAILAWGTVFYGHSVYMDALMRVHGWSASLVSSAVLVFWIASLPGTLFVGMLIDRKGPVPVVAVGGLCIGGGLYLLGQVTEHWQMFAIYAAMGFGYPALAAAAISATLTPWFDRGFGVALGIALTGASVGGAIVPPLMVQYSAVHGFGATMAVAGIVVLAVVFVAVLLLYLVGRPSGSDRHIAAAVPYSMLAIIGHWRFWAIAIPVALGLGGQVGLLAHQVPIIAMHIDQVSAAFMVTVVAISSAVGRLLVGLLSRYLSVTVLAALSYVLHGTGIALLAIAHSEVWIFAACAVAGLTVGAIVMLPPLIVRQVYGTTGFGRTYAMVNVVMYVFAGLSPWLVGVLRDAMGNYSAALWMLVALEVLAAVCILGALRQRAVGDGQSQT